MARRVTVEVFQTFEGEAGYALEAGWYTDSTGSRYWSGRRWQQLVERDQIARLVDARGNVVQFGA